MSVSRLSRERDDCQKQIDEALDSISVLNDVFSNCLNDSERRNEVQAQLMKLNKELDNLYSIMEQIDYEIEQGV